jgi:hypothetical protein
LQLLLTIKFAGINDVVTPYKRTKTLSQHLHQDCLAPLWYNLYIKNPLS